MFFRIFTLVFVYPFIYLYNILHLLYAFYATEKGMSVSIYVVMCMQCLRPTSRSRSLFKTPRRNGIGLFLCRTCYCLGSHCILVIYVCWTSSVWVLAKPSSLNWQRRHPRSTLCGGGTGGESHFAHWFRPKLKNIRRCVGKEVVTPFCFVKPSNNVDFHNFRFFSTDKNFTH